MKQAPIRILLAKIGLDGHDRGVKVLARTFRDAGMEVIYTGLWQTPSVTAKAAVEEDVDVCGASFHSAAHLTLVPILMDELRKRGRADMPVVIGGIIPHEDVPIMKDSGVAGVFEPEDSLEHIIDSVKKIALVAREERQAAWKKKGAIDGWIASAARGDRTALGQVLTWVESEPPAAEISKFLAPTGNGALVIGVTGSPGVGKSTMIGRLAKELSSRGKEVAVVAVDPASPITGGALLGDRARMTLAAEESRIYLRSCASRGQLGGLAPSTGLMIQAMTNAKFDVLIVETVGAGQSDIAVRQWAKPLLLVMMPGAGDDLQLAKAGITEVADMFVINKADLPGADRLQSQIRDTLGTKRPVIKTVASHGKGIAELADSLLAGR
jgi:LAO/AO transport system ATPase